MSDACACIYILFCYNALAILVATGLCPVCNRVDLNRNRFASSWNRIGLSCNSIVSSCNWSASSYNRFRPIAIGLFSQLQSVLSLGCNCRVGAFCTENAPYIYIYIYTHGKMPVYTFELSKNLFFNIRLQK
jgi:hypothetical protein